MNKLLMKKIPNKKIICLDNLIFCHTQQEKGGLMMLKKYIYYKWMIIYFKDKFYNIQDLSFDLIFVNI